MEIAGREPVEFDSAWDLLDRVSSDLFQHAVRTLTGAVDVHAAVFAKGDATVVFAGEPGAGKSTMTLELLLRGEGWGYVSDDLAPLHLDTGRVAPLRKPVSIKDPERWAELARLWDPPGWLADPSGPFLLPGSALVSAGEESRAPTHVVFPQRGEPGAGVEPVLAGEAVYLLAEMVGRLDPAKLRALSRMCGEATTVRLGYGSPDEGAAAIERLVGA